MIYIFSLLIFLLFVSILFINHQFKLITYKQRVKIVMYHSLSVDQFEDQITISKEKFIQQLEYFKNQGYTTINLTDITSENLPKKPLMITFDDGFLDNYEHGLPLLKHYGFKAVCFLVLGRIGQTMDWGGEFVMKDKKLMTIDQINEAQSHIEFAYHTYKHDNYENLSIDEIREDLELCKNVNEKNILKLFPALAYAYGGYYRKRGKEQNELFSLFKEFGIKYAFRVGNRIALYPFTNNWKINRIDIRGDESMKLFKRRIKWGRIKLM